TSVWPRGVDNGKTEHLIAKVVLHNHSASPRRGLCHNATVVSTEGQRRSGRRSAQEVTPGRIKKDVTAHSIATEIYVCISRIQKDPTLLIRHQVDGSRVQRG